MNTQFTDQVRNLGAALVAAVDIGMGALRAPSLMRAGAIASAGVVAMAPSANAGLTPQQIEIIEKAQVDCPINVYEVKKAEL